MLSSAALSICRTLRVRVFQRPCFFPPSPLTLSPPFAGAAMDREPVPFDLGESLPAAQAQDQHHLQPPSQANGAGSPLADCGGSGSSIERDDAVSRARSRRLVSGYRFGNPPSPVEKLRQATGEMEEGPDTEGEVEASQQSDSPPLTDELSDEEDDSEVSAEVEALGSEMLPAQARAMAGLTLQQSRVPPSTLGAPPKRSERGVRGTAWDLKGLNDGEADADASALPAEHGSAEYLRGEGGPAGEYRFPKHRLRQKMKGEYRYCYVLTVDESKIPLVIVACGSFSPPTYLHLRMFEMAKDEIVESQTYEIMAGYYSPVSSYYKKAGLAPAEHRVRMCELAVEHTSTWLMVDPWEAGQPEYQRTAVVLEHFDHLLNGENGGVTMSDGSRRKYKIMLLAGGDLIESFGEPGVWSEPDVSCNISPLTAVARNSRPFRVPHRRARRFRRVGIPPVPRHSVQAQAERHCREAVDLQRYLQYKGPVVRPPRDEHQVSAAE